MDQVRALIWQMISSIVDTPNRVKVEAVIDDGVTCYLVQARENEVGQVIGKQGHTARAVRTILAAIAMKEKRQLNLILPPTQPRFRHRKPKRLGHSGQPLSVRKLLPNAF